MKKAIIVLLFLAALIGAYVGGNSRAQQPAAKQAVKSTKVGVVNYPTLYRKCDKVEILKKRIDKEIRPFKNKKEELEKTIEEWQEIVQNPGKLKESNIARGKRIIIDCRRQLEDLDTKFKKDISHVLEKEMSQLTSAIDDEIRDYARQHGFDLMLGYGEPENALAPAVKFRNEVAAVDAGMLIQAHAAGAVDVTAEVLKRINDGARAAQPVKNDEPK